MAIRKIDKRNKPIYFFSYVWSRSAKKATIPPSERDSTDVWSTGVWRALRMMCERDKKYKYMARTRRRDAYRCYELCALFMYIKRRLYSLIILRSIFSGYITNGRLHFSKQNVARAQGRWP